MNEEKIVVFVIVCMVCIFSIVFIRTGFLKQYDVTLESFSVHENGSKIVLRIKTKSNQHVRKIKVKQSGEKKNITFYSNFQFFHIGIGAKNAYEISLDDTCKEIYFDTGNGEFSLVLKKNEKKNQWERYEKSDDLLTDKEIENMKYVDDRVNQLLTSSKYKEMTIENQVVEVENLLKQLKKEKYIKNYNYNSDSYLFGYEYECGVLGGVMLNDFDDMLN